MRYDIIRLLIVEELLVLRRIFCLITAIRYFSLVIGPSSWQQREKFVLNFALLVEILDVAWSSVIIG